MYITYVIDHFESELEIVYFICVYIYTDNRIYNIIYIYIYNLNEYFEIYYLCIYYINIRMLSIIFNYMK